MLIVDAQVHIWGAGPPTTRSHRQVEVFSVDELLTEMDAAGVDAAVIHPPGWDPNSSELAAEAFEKLPELLALARYPNVAVKATGAPNYSSEGYPFRSIQPYLRQVFDAFGPERMFWGTDISRMRPSYRECVTFFTEELPWLSERDKELIMGRALLAWLDWQRPG